jgi:FlaA1/EpsC-like NDP-sugar epimerase
MDNSLVILGRNEPLFDDDIEYNNNELSKRISSSKFLVIGGAGTIGSAVVKELFSRNPKVLHVVDISENNRRIIRMCGQNLSPPRKGQINT